MTRFVCISDLHEKQDQITLPEGDVLIVAGDSTIDGRMLAIERFFRWLEDQQQYKRRILIAGNHDISFQTRPAAVRELLKQWAPSVTYLEDQSTYVDGMRIYGSPWTPEFKGGWNFHKPRPEMHTVWDEIPNDVDVLITHGPPFGILDLTREGVRAGCEALMDRLPKLSNLKLHVFGHIHEGYGVKATYDDQGVIYVNASTCNRVYQPVNDPVVIDIEL